MIPGVDELDMATVPHPLRLLGTTRHATFANQFRASISGVSGGDLARQRGLLHAPRINMIYIV